MSFIATVWQWLRAEIGDHRLQFRLCLRVTVAAIVAFLLSPARSCPGNRKLMAGRSSGRIAVAQ
jgi:hypothetical protein